MDGKFKALIFLAILHTVIGWNKRQTPDGELQLICRLINTCQNHSESFPEKYDNLLTRVCMCDEACSRYNDCCMDSPYHQGQPQQNPTECTNSLVIDNIYVVKTCPSNFRDDQIIKYCVTTDEDELKKSLMLSVPVVDNTTTFTYKNVFCAICNGVKEYIFWSYGTRRTYEIRNIVHEGHDEGIPDMVNTGILSAIQVTGNYNFSFVEESNILFKQFGNNESLPLPIRYCRPDIAVQSCIESCQVDGVVHCVNRDRNDNAGLRLTKAFDIDHEPHWNNKEIPEWDPFKSFKLDSISAYPELSSVHCHQDVSFEKDSSVGNRFIETVVKVCDSTLEESRPIGVPALNNPALDNPALNYPAVYDPRIYLNDTGDVTKSCDTSHVISYGFSVFSLILLIITLATHIYQLNGLPDKLMFSACITLLIADIVNVASGPFKKSELVCKVGAVVAHYLSLSYFMWLLMIAYEFGQMIVAPTSDNNATVRRNPRLNRYRIYSIVSWFSPLTIVLISLTLYTESKTYFKTSYGAFLSCFLPQQAPFDWFYVVPLSLICISIVIMFFCTFYSMQGDISAARYEYCKIFAEIAVCAVLTCALTICWIFIHPEIFYNIFETTNSFHSVIMFLMYGLQMRNFN